MEQAFERNEHTEQLEKTEQVTSLETMDQMIETYADSCGEASREGCNDMAEYYKEKRIRLEQEAAELQQRIQLDRIERSGAPRYSGAYKYESEWTDAAEREFVKRGPSSYYHYCLKQAGICHVEEQAKK